LEELKGIHLFLDAIDKIRSPASFYVAGHGSYAPLVEDAERAHGRLHFLRTIKMAEVPYFLSKTDILVLPSITMDDGWGAVVSEALMAGAAVVSSDRVGASMCLSDEVRGAVVRELTGAAVATAVDGIIRNGLCAMPFREIRSQWADDHLTVRVGVEYLLKILDHVFHGQVRPMSFVQ
jgi:glycosyltransferase involved in cell wall biosynthesis